MNNTTETNWKTTGPRVGAPDRNPAARAAALAAEAEATAEHGTAAQAATLG